VGEDGAHFLMGGSKRPWKGATRMGEDGAHLFDGGRNKQYLYNIYA
jgi:hypothetical protein